MVKVSYGQVTWNYFFLLAHEKMLIWKATYSNLPNNRVGPFNRVGGRFLNN